MGPRTITMREAQRQWDNMTPDDEPEPHKDNREDYDWDKEDCDDK
jgi:hypothetical protein